MISQLEYVSRKFYDKLTECRNRYSNYVGNIEADRVNIELLDGFMLNLRSYKEGFHGLLDELENPELRDELPWDHVSCKTSIKSLNGCIENFNSVYTSLAYKSRMADSMHRLNLDTSYTFFQSVFVLEGLMKINGNDNISYGYWFEVFTDPDKLKSNFKRISSSLARL